MSAGRAVRGCSARNAACIHGMVHGVILAGIASPQGGGMRHVAWIAVLGAMGLAAAEPVSAQNYPSNPVKVISDSAPGSAPDVILRVVTDQLGQRWGQQVVVQNQPGA